MVTRFARKIKEINGRVFYVGGYTRDLFLGVQPVDVDVVVFGCEFRDVLRIASEIGESKVVGNNFPVIKLGDIDIALARRETKTGDSYTDFHTEYDKGVSLDDDAIRRDLTINAIYVDVLTREVIDPVCGVADIKNKELRHVSNKFAESVERPLRVAQLHARYPDFSIHQSTKYLCGDMVETFNLVPSNQVLQQFTKLLLRGKKPSVGLRDLKEFGYISVFPELASMIGVEQNQLYHPEGDVFEHTCQVVDAMARLTVNSDAREKLVLMLAALLHDAGKPDVTKRDETGKITSHKHSHNTKPVDTFLSSINAPLSIRESVITLVKEHMILAGSVLGSRAVRRLATRLGDSASVEQLATLIKADRAGRSVDGNIEFLEYRDVNNMLETSRLVGVNKQPEQGILMGRHLIELGLRPSKFFGILLRDAKIAQDNEVFSDLDGAKEFALDYVREIGYGQ